MDFLGNQTRIVYQNSRVFRKFVIFLLIFCAFGTISKTQAHQNINSNGSSLFGIELPGDLNSGFASPTNTPCSFNSEEEGGGGGELLNAKSHKQSVKLHLKKRSTSQSKEPKESITQSTVRDLARIQTLHTRITEKKNQDTTSRLTKNDVKHSKPAVSPAAAPASYGELFSGQLMATLGSGVTLGSGEYFIDVFVGTPPKHFSLILDTGSDLNWIQCTPCHDCFEQNGPYYNPKDSISFRNVTCRDPRCQLVSSPDPPQPCKFDSQSCPYFYWYGDNSNTTGDFALETFTVNLTSSTTGQSEFRRVENVMFGCGHWNRGLFHGAAGLLGLGRGPLSFSSQLQSIYGHSFSYCLVDRNSDPSVSSKLIFGEDRDLLAHPELTFTSLIGGKENPVDTFYYLQIKSIVVGGEVLKIPAENWKLSAEGGGGTIIDSGTTLSYFSDPAYQIIKEAFLTKVTKYKLVEDFPILHPCYNVSGVGKLDLPEFGINFADGAVWNFPVENYFIKIDQLDVVCLAILGTPKSALSIIGNYQQQNFHILYDTKNSRLGYAPMRCAEV